MTHDPQHDDDDDKQQQPQPAPQIVGPHLIPPFIIRGDADNPNLTPSDDDDDEHESEQQ